MTPEQLMQRQKRELIKQWGNGITSYEITSREMDEKEAIGLYYVDITMGNGKVRSQAMPVVKKSGKWLPGFADSNYNNRFTLKEIVEFYKDFAND
jgi:hypothetical protein